MILAPPRYSCKSGSTSSALFLPWQWASIIRTGATDADIGRFDLKTLLSGLAYLRFRSNTDTPSPGLFRIVEWELRPVECPFDHEIELLSSSWAEVATVSSPSSRLRYIHTTQNVQVGKKKDFIEMLARYYYSCTTSSPTKSNFSAPGLLFSRSIEISRMPTYKRGILIQRYRCGTGCQPRIYRAGRTGLR